MVAAQKDMLGASVLGLSHFKFLSIPFGVVVYAMFGLGIVLLLLFLVLPRLPISCRCFCLDGAPLHAISGRNQRREASRKDMFDVSVLLTTVAAIAIDVNLPIGLSHFKFLSIPYVVVVFTVFALGMVLLLLSLVLPRLPISYGCLHLDGAPLHTNNERNQRREASRKDMFYVSILLITVASIAIDLNLPIGLSHFKFLFIPYVVVVFTMVALGIVLLLLSLVLPRLRISYRCLHLDGAPLHTNNGRNQRREARQKDMSNVSVLLITVAAIAIDVNLPIGVSQFKFLSIPCIVVVYAMFALGIVLLLLSLVLPRRPISYRCFHLDGAPLYANNGRNQRCESSQKDMFKVSILLITVAAIAIDVNLPIGLSQFKFLSIPYVVVVYTMFALGIVLLLLSLVLPRRLISYRCLRLDGAPLYAISRSNQRCEASQKDMLKVSILLITIASIVMDANLPIRISPSIPYIVVIYAMFAMGTRLLMLSLVLPKVPASCRCLRLDGASHHTIGGRNQRHEASQKNMVKVSILLIIVAAIAIDANLPIGLPLFKFLTIPYAVVIYAMFVLGTMLLLLSLVLPEVPASYRCLHLDGALHHAICGRNQRHEACQKNMFKVSILLITVTAIALDTNLPISFPHFKFFSIPYAVVIYAMFALGTVLLLLSLILPQVPTSPGCLHLDGAGHHAINERNQ